MSKLFIGTSGWSYDHWQGRFYPPDLPKIKWLEYYSQHFNTVEVNSTFYHLPQEKTVKNWMARTPANFTFAVKASRFITHFKQLKDPVESLEKFLQTASWFGERLGPILFQFPPKFAKNAERLSEFLSVLPQSWRIALEFRHSSWFCEEIYELIHKHKVALCFSDTPWYPYCEEITADFVYLRLHGHEELYASKYTKKQLDEYAKKIKNWLQGVSPPNGRVNGVYCYFDNDANAYAVENGKELHNKISNF
ncbi:MAG: DUF72 domain-containing protein [Candidatus Cloacimonetes bacterium]|nr:DUF72 domain-containing protein [Candidatus Cloacimonadota bacterium]